MVIPPDLRRIRFGIEISGRINWYEGLRVQARGIVCTGGAQDAVVSEFLNALYNGA